MRVVPRKPLDPHQPVRTPAVRLALALLLIAVLAINLRPAVVGVGPLLPQIRADLGLGSAAAGALTTLPVLCFGVFGLLAPALRRHFREEPLLVGSMVVLIVGLLIRVGPSSVTLLAGALLAGIAISVGNIAMPSLIKRKHPESVTFVTAVYTTALTTGAAGSAALMVPIEQATAGGWRVPLALLTVPALLACLAWLPLARRAGSATGDRPDGSGGGLPPGAARLWRTPLAWHVTAFMGLQSLLAYVVFGWLPTIAQDRGLDEASAGLVLAVNSVLQAAGALTVPAIDRRLRDQRPLVAFAVGLTVVGFAGIAWAPVVAIWPSTMLLGFGQGAAFALALAFIGLRSGDAHVAARLSGMAQGLGYLIAAVGPLGIGILHHLTGGWLIPTVLLVGIAVAEGIPGLVAGRARTIE